MYKSRNKIVSKFFEKTAEIQDNKDILTFLGLKYRDSQNEINRFITLHKNSLLKKFKINMYKIDVRTF